MTSPPSSNAFQLCSLRGTCVIEIGWRWYANPSKGSTSGVTRGGEGGEVRSEDGFVGEQAEDASIGVVHMVY